MNAITIKRITTHDDAYRQVWALREAVLRRPLGLSLHDEDLSSEAKEHIIIALDEAQVVGCLMLRPVSAIEMKARQMAVAQAFQGRGIGAALLREGEVLTSEQGCTYIALHARMTAVPFYERAGYARIGNVFTEVGLPHLLMQKQLS